MSSDLPVARRLPLPLPPPHRSSMQKRGDRVDHRSIRDKRVEFRPRRPARLLEAPAVFAKTAQVCLADHRRFLKQRPFTLQSPEPRPRFERELDLVAVQYLEQNDLVSIVTKSRQTLAQCRDRR